MGRRFNPWMWVGLATAGALGLLCCAMTVMNLRDGTRPAGGAAAGGGVMASAPAAPGVGDPVRDGAFEFIVRQVQCGVDSVGDSLANKTAKGHFCLVTLSVRNVGDAPRAVEADNQRALGSDRVKYSTDATAGSYANATDDQVWITEIDPGQDVTGMIVFDLPKNVKLAAVQLHDSGLSGGVDVKVG